MPLNCANVVVTGNDGAQLAVGERPRRAAARPSPFFTRPTEPAAAPVSPRKSYYNDALSRRNDK